MRRFCVSCATAVFASSAGACAADLQPETANAFDQYVRKAEMRMDERLQSAKFLWADQEGGSLNELRSGRVLAQPAATKAEAPAPHGLIHDWIGAVFIPGVTLHEVLSAVQDYDRHKFAYGPEVVDSKLLRRTGDDFHIYLRLRKKKVVTVTLNTEHDVHYQQLDAVRCRSRSYSTRIAEVANAGQRDERELPVGHDHGFMWRLYSYWRFVERDGGVYVECEAISLTRDVPAALSWLISPIIRNLPRESLIATLASTRNFSLSRKTNQAN